MVFSDFDHQKQILVTRFEGEIFLKEIIDYINVTKINKDYPRELRILTDSSKSNMLLSAEDLPMIVEENNNALKEYTYIVDAIVLGNPHDTAISYLYKEISKNKNYFFKLFSSNEAAIQWLINFKPSLNS